MLLSNSMGNPITFTVSLSRQKSRIGFQSARPDKLPPHSITSSASASSLSGTIRPSAFAVLRLMTRSSLVGNSIADQRAQRWSRRGWMGRAGRQQGRGRPLRRDRAPVPACGAATNPSAGDLVKKGRPVRVASLCVDGWRVGFTAMRSFFSGRAGAMKLIAKGAINTGE